MSLPVVLSLSPHGLVGPAHEKARALLPPHELRVVERTDAGVIAEIGSADLVLGDWTHELGLDAAALAAARCCRLVVQPTAGYDVIDVESARQHGIPVANCPGANARGVAEWAVMAMLMALKNATLNHDRTRRGQWCMASAADEGVLELADRTVGVLGFGQIGQGVARRLAGFGVREILYLDQFVDIDEVSPGVPVQRVHDVDELCRRSDVLSVHVPLLPETHHLIDTRRLELLGPDAVLVNTARGAVVDEDALWHALRDGGLKAAALDVFSDEPLTGPHRWAELDNVVLSPHIAGGTVEARDAMFAAAFTTLAQGLRGELPATIVNGVGSLRLG
jgi:phosphoglycerate dehydrogenase-like enzyme